MKEMNNLKLIITSEMLAPMHAQALREYQIAALFNDSRMVEVHVMPKDAGSMSILNNIYIARVQSMALHLNAAFVEIGSGLCYLPLEELKYPVFTRKQSKKVLAAGDELVVQVTKDAIKAKAPVVTTNLSFPGEYLVLTSANRCVGVSSRLPRPDRRRLQELAQQMRGTDTDYGLIVRTNAANVEDKLIHEEFKRLLAEYRRLLATAPTRTVYSCLKMEQPFYLRFLMDIRKDRFHEVITDDPLIYEQLQQAADSGGYGLRLYEDRLLALPRLYNLNGQIEAALKDRVWLKSGANIVIQPTEALTVIDVNSGKNIAKKEKQLYHYRINLEAAEEIARQLRLRNLSGIIVIDFIDLYDDALNESLLAEFGSFLKSDPVPAHIVDMTRLGLVEVTRKKIRRPLREVFSEHPDDDTR